MNGGRCGAWRRGPTRGRVGPQTHLDLLCLDGVCRDDSARGGGCGEGAFGGGGAKAAGKGFSEHGEEDVADDGSEEESVELAREGLWTLARRSPSRPSALATEIPYAAETNQRPVISHSPGLLPASTPLLFSRGCTAPACPPGSVVRPAEITERTLALPQIIYDAANFESTSTPTFSTVIRHHNR